MLHSNSQTFLRNKKERRFVLGATQHSAKSAASGSRRRIEPPTRGRTSPTLRRAWPKDGPLAAICVQSVDVPCVLQFTLIHAAGCVLHRRTSRVIHRLKLFSLSFCNFFGSPTSTISARQRSRANGSPMFHRSVYHEEKKGKKKDTRGAASAGLFKPSPRRTVDDMEALSSASPVGPAGSSRAGARHPHRTGTPVSHFFRVAGRPKPWRPSSQPRSRLPAVTDGPAVFWRGLRVAGRVRQHASPS